jgi:LPXTG-motif cell wall-anchored protein
MDTTIIIRLVAGALAAAVLGIVVYRRKKAAQAS